MSTSEKTRTPFEQIAATINSFLPLDLTDDVRRNIQAAVRSTFERLDLVTREELEVQEAVLARTREKLERLQERVEELEQARDG